MPMLWHCLFFQAGCSVHSRDNAKNTPLHLAAGCGFLNAVVKLVQHGADLDARDMSECTPLQNTAHGTYSALAHVPSGGTPVSGGTLQVESHVPFHVRRSAAGPWQSVTEEVRTVIFSGAEGMQR